MLQITNNTNLFAALPPKKPRFSPADVSCSPGPIYKLPEADRFLLLLIQHVKRSAQRDSVAMASSQIAMASNVVAMASNLVAMASSQIPMASILVAMASNLIAMASNPVAMASNLLAMASTLVRET